jgi:hypothetical protein
MRLEVIPGLGSHGYRYCTETAPLYVQHPHAVALLHEMRTEGCRGCDCFIDDGSPSPLRHG